MIFDLTANTNSRKIMVLNPSYPQDVTKTVIKGNTVSATFSVVISVPGRPDAYTYQWYVNGRAISGANGPSYTRTGLSATATDTVYCIVTNKAGSVKSRVATLKVTQYYTPVLNNGYPADTTVVKGNSATCKVAIATAGVPDSYTYQWYRNGSAVSGATSSSYTFTPTATGTTTVYCKVTNSAGTVTSRTATITATHQYLYNEGNEVSAFTTAVNISSSSVSIGDTIKLIVGEMHAGWVGVGTSEKYDLRGVSTLKCQFKGDSSKVNNVSVGARFGVTTAKIVSGTNSYTWAAETICTTLDSLITLSVDVSSVDEGYISFFGLLSGEIYNIWVE